MNLHWTEHDRVADDTPELTMRFFLALTTVALALSGPAAAAAGPSFSCDGQLKPAERIVCDDADMSRIDRNIDRSYRVLLQASGWAERARHRRSQRAFITDRDACGRDFQCIRLAYRGQGQELRGPLRKFNILCDDESCYQNNDAR